MIGAGAFVAFGEGYEGMLPVRRLRGDWWELNEEGTILDGTRAGAAIRLGDPIRVRVGAIDARARARRPRAGVDGSSRGAPQSLLSVDGEGKRRSLRATSRRTATPRTATTCSSGSSAASC